MKISKNFTMEEFSVSASYPQLATGVPIQLQSNVKLLVIKVLQPLCDATGWRDRILSGYRSLELNTKVGGSLTSQHMTAEASDNQFFNTYGNIKIIDVMKKVVELGLDFDQMIAYPTFVHLSYTVRRKNRKMILYNQSYKDKRL